MAHRFVTSSAGAGVTQVPLSAVVTAALTAAPLWSLLSEKKIYLVFFF